MELVDLNQENLRKLADIISCPTYERKDIKSGIVHIGVGGFHRSHQAYYIHQLLGRNEGKEWGICGVGLRETDRRMYDILGRQDHLYTLISQHPDGNTSSEVVGSINDYLLAVDDPDLLIKKLVHTDTKIVSLTITEGGYNFNASTGDFNFENTDVIHELRYPDQPKTVYGYLTLALSKRKELGISPFTVLSCDNIQHNGDMMRKMLLAFVRRRNVELAEWIEENVSFPNTMVDRITPVSSQRDITYLQDKYNLKDEWPVVCEPFIQWVVEDHFSCGRPPLELLGVQFVPDVTPYEKMKLRLLNAGHSVLGIIGAIHGHASIQDCMEDTVFANFMRQFMDIEAGPVLDLVEGIDLEKYKDSLEERFSNPNIKDGLSRICSESSAKLPKFLIPTIKENLDAAGSIKLGTLILAAWCYYSDKGISEKGEQIEIIDHMKDDLHNAAKDSKTDALTFLRNQKIFGDLISNERFTLMYKVILDLIYKEEGIKKVMLTVAADSFQC